MVFSFKNCSDLLWEKKNVLVMEKNVLKFEVEGRKFVNNFSHLNNLFKQWIDWKPKSNKKNDVKNVYFSKQVQFLTSSIKVGKKMKTILIISLHWIPDIYHRSLHTRIYKTDIQFWTAAAEKKNANCHMYATFEGIFFMFSGAKKKFMFFSKIL